MNKTYFAHLFAATCSAFLIAACTSDSKPASPPEETFASEVFGTRVLPEITPEQIAAVRELGLEADLLSDILSDAKVMVQGPEEQQGVSRDSSLGPRKRQSLYLILKSGCKFTQNSSEETLTASLQDNGAPCILTVKNKTQLDQSILEEQNSTFDDSISTQDPALKLILDVTSFSLSGSIKTKYTNIVDNKAPANETPEAKRERYEKSYPDPRKKNADEHSAGDFRGTMISEKYGTIQLRFVSNVRKSRKDAIAVTSNTITAWSLSTAKFTVQVREEIKTDDNGEDTESYFINGHPVEFEDYLKVTAYASYLFPVGKHLF